MPLRLHERIGLGVIALLAMALALSLERAHRLEVALATRPKVEQRAAAVRQVQKAPGRTSKTTVRRPDGTVETSVVTDRGAELATTASVTERKETPVAVPQPWRFAGAELARNRHTALRLGVSLWGIEFSARHELPYGGRLEFNPWVGVGVRW